MAVMIPDFKGHHFAKVADAFRRYRCERCGMTAELEEDGAATFADHEEILTRIGPDFPLESSHVPRCK
jgi:hypothetical protein